MNAREIPDAIQWHEGLLLTPEHFQQLSARHEALVEYSSSVLAPFFWGVRRFKHHAISLPAGKLRVVEFEGIMPDGLVVSFEDSSTGEPLEIDLTKYAEQLSEQAVTVYLAVAARQADNSKEDVTRYESCKGGLVSDEMRKRKSATIYRLKPRLNLLVTESLPARFVGFPLAKVTYRDSFALDEDFTPPLLAISVDSNVDDGSGFVGQRLGDMCSETVQRVRKRAMYLADQNRSGLIENEARSEAVTANLMLGLVGCLPHVEAVLKTGVTPPYTVYQAFCAMAGQLAVLGREMVPPSFNRYDHNDLYATFKPVLDFINHTIDQGIPLTYKTFPFRYKEGAYELHFDGEWMKKRLAIGIKVPRGMTESDVIKWGESCLIGSRSKIGSMRANRIRGALRKHTNRVGDVFPSRGMVLFSLSIEAGFIEPEETLQILNHNGLHPAEIVLHVMD